MLRMFKGNEESMQEVIRDCKMVPVSQANGGKGGDQKVLAEICHLVRNEGNRVLTQYVRGDRAKKRTVAYHSMVFLRFVFFLSYPFEELCVNFICFF
jgi:hypothetical protein